jgi:hypothetical protein
LKSQKKPSIPRSEQQNRGNIWIWIGVILIAVLAAAVLIYRSQQGDRFSIVSGEKQILVLLRNEKSSDYRLRYQGRQPIDLNAVKVMLAGQVLHVDVKPVVLVKDGQELQVQPDGSLPPGTVLHLEPDDEFAVRVTYLGQTLGGNYLYGFKLGYSQDGRERAEDLVMQYDYEVIVQ